MAIKKDEEDPLHPTVDPITPPETNAADTPPEANDETNPEPQPKYFNRLTGKETTEALSNTRHTAFVISSDSPMYGISGADLLIEFPIEDGSTRLLAFIHDTESISKIGSLSKTRGYISNLAKAFDSTVFAYGNDDAINYSKCLIDDEFTNEEKLSGLVYKEFAKFTYTGGVFLKNAFTFEDLDINSNGWIIPFVFYEERATVKCETYFNKIVIPYSQTSVTSLTYMQDTSLYVFEKNDLQTTDITNGKSVRFKNCFILFADSATYENQDATQMVLNTIGDGEGYYFTEGTAKQIKWSLNQNGEMKLYDEDYKELTVNPGSSYISFVKSSKIGDIVLH